MCGTGGRRTMWGPARRAAFAIAAVVVLAGCGGSDGNGDDTADDADVTAATSSPATTQGDGTTQAIDALNEAEAPGDEAPEGFQTLVSGDLVVRVPDDWQDIDLEPGTGGETSIRAAPALSDFGNGGVGLGVSVYEEAYPPATVFETLEAGLSTDDFDVQVSACADQQDVDFPGNAEMDATVRVHAACTGADPAAVYLLASMSPTDQDDVTIGVYAFATDQNEIDDLIHSLSSVSLEGLQL